MTDAEGMYFVRGAARKAKAEARARRAWGAKSSHQWCSHYTRPSLPSFLCLKTADALATRLAAALSSTRRSSRIRVLTRALGRWKDLTVLNDAATLAGARAWEGPSSTTPWEFGSQQGSRSSSRQSSRPSTAKSTSRCAESPHTAAPASLVASASLSLTDRETAFFYDDDGRPCSANKVMRTVVPLGGGAPIHVVTSAHTRTHEESLEGLHRNFPLSCGLSRFPLRSCLLANRTHSRGL